MTLIDVVQRKVQGYFSHLAGPSYVRVLDTPHVWGQTFDDQIMPQSLKRQAEFRRAIEEIIQKSHYRCDLSSLNSPDPDWGKVVLGAMDTALTRRMGRTAPTQFRFLFGQTPLYILSDPPNYIDFKAALVRLLRARASAWEVQPDIWIGRFYRLVPGIISAVQAKVFGSEALDSDDTKMTWNHSKIIAVDGTEALVGGHNLNMDLFRSYPPVHDLSVVVHGEAAYGAQRFLDQMWACGPSLLVKERLDATTMAWSTQTDLTRPADPLAGDAARAYMAAQQQAIVQLHQSGTQSGTDDPPLPQPPPTPAGLREQDLQTFADLQLQVLPERINYGTYDRFADYKRATRMLSVGKYWVGPNRATDYERASEIMKQEVIKGAQRTIRMSQMDLISAWKKNWSDHVVCQWLMDALRTNPQLVVQVVVSALDAGAGAEGDQYSFGSGAVRTFDLIKYYMTHDVATDALLDDDDGSRADALSRIQIAPLYYTDLVPAAQTGEGTTYKWPGLTPEGYTKSLQQPSLAVSPPRAGVIGSAAWSVLNAGGFTRAPVPSAPGNHAKLTIIDDELYVVGSDNLYPGTLSEFNYLIEGADAVNDLLAGYWQPLWHYSSPHALSGPVAGARIDAVKQAIAAVHPEAHGVWSYSTANQMPDDWLLATPDVPWGTPYAQFKLAVPGAYPDFGLAPCTPPDDGTHQCRPVHATVKTLGEQPATLSVGPSDGLVDQIYDVITGAETFVDLVLRGAPDGRFLAAIRNAVTFLSHKPDGRRPSVRVICSDPAVGAPTQATALLGALVRDVYATTPMPIYVGVVSAAMEAWNHATIIAADGARAIVGGHDLLAAASLGANPTFDVSMKVAGQAALAAHDHAEALWQLALGAGAGAWQWYTFTRAGASNVAGRVLDPGTHAYTVAGGQAPPADLYLQVRAQLAAPGAGQVPVIAAAKRVNQGNASFFPTSQSYLVALTEPGDLALRALVDTARSTLQCSQPAPAAGSPWDLALFRKLGSALTRNVDVYLTISNADPAVSPAVINQYMLEVLTRTMSMTDDAARAAIAAHLHVASLRFSAGDDAYPGAVPIVNHARSMIADQAIFYVGSQALAPSPLDDLGYIVEDRVAALTYTQRYWQPLWAQSQRTATAAYSDDLVKAMQGEALLFVLELNRNVRLQKTWSDTLARRSSLTAPADLVATAVILDDIIRNAGFCTTPTSVLDALRSPFFTTDRANHEANDDARRFVTDLMTKRDLLAAFTKTLQDQATARETDADAAINSFLTGQGYSCDASQVSAAADELRRDALSHWIGEYQAWLRPDGGASFADFTPAGAGPAPHARTLLATAGDGATTGPVSAPVLTVVDNTHVKLGDDDLKGLTFGNRVLAWDTSAGNRTSGSLTFSQITQPGFLDPYIGFEAFGTITFPDDRGTVSYYARWNRLVNVDDPDSRKPVLWPVWLVLGLLALFGGVGFAIARWRRQQAFERVAREEILRDIADYEVLIHGDSTAFDQLRSDLENGRITASTFKTRIADLKRLARQQGDEVELVRDESRRGLARNQRRLAAPQSRDQVIRDAQDSLRAMSDSESDMIESSLELNPGSVELQNLAQSAARIDAAIYALTPETSPATLDALFGDAARQTTQLRQVVQDTAKSQARGNQDWIDRTRTLDRDRLDAVERANDAQLRLDSMDRVDPRPDTTIPEDRIDLPTEDV